MKNNNGEDFNTLLSILEGEKISEIENTSPIKTRTTKLLSLPDEIKNNFPPIRAVRRMRSLMAVSAEPPT